MDCVGNNLTSEEVALEAVAQTIKRMRLEVPAALFLEMHKPLCTLLHTATIGITPLLSPFFGVERLQNLEKIFSSRENIEILISKIEQN